MNNTSKPTSNWALIVRWIIFSTLGLVAGIALGLSLADPVEALVGMMLVTPVVLVAAGGIFATSQWLAIWKRHRLGFVWIGVTAIALGIGMTVGIVVVETVGRSITGEQMRLSTTNVVERTVSLLAIGAFTGFAVGLSQWLIARRFLSPKWIVITTFAFLIGFPCGSLVVELLPGGLESLLGFAMFLGITGLVVGAMTARSAHSIANGLATKNAG